MIIFKLVMVVVMCVAMILYILACVCAFVSFIFCFEQKTAYEMRISDWSSDVCSSDLTVSEAVMRMDLASQPAMMFRNSAHGGLNMIYQRSDGNIGWIDPRGNRGE